MSAMKAELGLPPFFSESWQGTGRWAIDSFGRVSCQAARNSPAQSRRSEERRG